MEWKRGLYVRCFLWAILFCRRLLSRELGLWDRVLRGPADGELGEGDAAADEDDARSQLASAHIPSNGW